MRYFEEFHSNTCGGSGNQFFFGTGGKVETGRVYYQITHGGNYRYSLLFSNVMDSTYSDGSISHCNLICDSWELLETKVGKCSHLDMNVMLDRIQRHAESGQPEPEFDLPVTQWQRLTFDGKTSKTVRPGEFFSSDPVELEFEAGEYLCLETTFRGEQIPCHVESILPVFRKGERGWVYSKFLPVASMVGCDRPVKKRIGYLGDSITQGCGTEVDSYTHWNAVVSRLMGDDYAYWNLGIGFGRGQDGASDGAWLFRAKQNDIVVVCFGVNDIFQIGSAEQTKKDLTVIVEKLKAAGCKVLLQTVPPFDYGENPRKIWEDINSFIHETLSEKADRIFDTVPVLGQTDKPHMAKYGGHPDAAGCAAWAEALYPVLKELAEE